MLLGETTYASSGLPLCFFCNHADGGAEIDSAGKAPKVYS